MSSAAEKHAKANTLSCVIGLCIGKVTTVELRNESHVTGRIVEVSVWKSSSHRFELIKVTFKLNSGGGAVKIHIPLKSCINF
jgi:hypothetical protein